MKKNFKFFLILFLFFLILSCATQRLYKPLNKEEFELHFTLGGPLIKIGNIPLIMPFAYLGYKMHITDNFSAGVDLPLTLIALNNFALDVNGIYFIKKKIAIQMETLFVWDIGANISKFYPLISIWYVFHIKENLYIMPGISSLYQSQTPYINASPFISFIINKGSWDFSIEFSYLVPYLKNEYTVDYISPGYGGIGFYFGISRKL